MRLPNRLKKGAATFDSDRAGPVVRLRLPDGVPGWVVGIECGRDETQPEEQAHRQQQDRDNLIPAGTRSNYSCCSSTR